MGISSNQEPAAKLPIKIVIILKSHQSWTLTFMSENSCYLGSKLKILYLVGFSFLSLLFWIRLALNSRLRSNHLLKNITATLQITFLVAWMGGKR